MALDVLCISDKQYALIREHAFGKAFMKLSVYFMSNHHVNSGAIHRARPLGNRSARKGRIGGCLHFSKILSTRSD